GVSDEEAPKLAKKMLDLVGLDEKYLPHSPFELSGGHMRRVAIAGVLAIAESYEMDRLTSLILGIVADVVVLPKTVTTESGEVVTKVLSFEWLGTQ
ncbi:hypothetical protein RGT46_15290, partial [Enterococcus faecalis]